MKKQKSLKTALSGYYLCVLHDMLLMPSGADTQTYSNVWGWNVFKKPSVHLPQSHVPGLKVLKQHKIT